MVEHNVLSASLLYQNIGFDQLATLLEISAERAEKVAAKMMMEERLQGSIDQVGSGRALVLLDGCGRWRGSSTFTRRWKRAMHWHSGTDTFDARAQR